MVMDFYNMRKNELHTVSPNDAHRIIAELEKDFDVTVVTQNVDDLHERAGSTKIIHLHGSLLTLKPEDDGQGIHSYKDDLKIGDVDERGVQLRPNIVWFGEGLNPLDVNNAVAVAEEADVCVIVGTSMQVAPANGIPWQTPELAQIYYVDPGEVDFHVPKFRMKAMLFTHVKKGASDGVKQVAEDLRKIFLK
jgi:NAD-dependent deacetylase